MRWPWELVPWGRGRGANASDSAAGDAGSPAPGSADPPSAEAFQSAPAATPAAWSRLPPLQRSVADSTAIAPPAAFRSSLTTHQNPSFLAPLGHLVDPDGPAGVVGGLASSVGGPIPYEGVDELRVPERPAPPSAPAAQRRIATLRPEDPAVQRHGDAAVPSHSPDHDHGGVAETSLIETGSPEAPASAASEPAAPESPGPAPLVVARSAASRSPLPSARTDSGGRGGPSPALDATVPAPSPSITPLTVPVQRSATSTGSNPGSTAAPGQIGDLSSPATPRSVSSTPPADTELVVARSGAETGDGQSNQQPVDDPPPTAPSPDPTTGDTAVAGLLASRPLVESSSIDTGPPPADAPGGDTAPLTVPSGENPRQGSGPTLQRRFMDQPPAGSTSLSPVVSPAMPPGTTSTSGSLPPGLVAPAGSPTAGLDDQGYPPLIARSVQRSTVGTDEAGHTPAPSAAAPAPGSDAHAATPQAPLSGFSAAISALQDPPLGPPLGGESEELSDRPGESSQHPPLVVARRVAPDQTGNLPDTGRAPATNRRRHTPCNTPTDPAAAQPDRQHVAPRPTPGHAGQRSTELLGARGAATPVRGRRRPERESPRHRSAARSR